MMRGRRAEGERSAVQRRRLAMATSRVVDSLGHHQHEAFQAPIQSLWRRSKSRTSDCMTSAKAGLNGTQRASAPIETRYNHVMLNDETQRDALGALRARVTRMT